VVIVICDQYGKTKIKTHVKNNMFLIMVIQFKMKVSKLIINEFIP
jgi:hypothetical protein